MFSVIAVGLLAICSMPGKTQQRQKELLMDPVKNLMNTTYLMKNHDDKLYKLFCGHVRFYEYFCRGRSRDFKGRVHNQRYTCIAIFILSQTISMLILGGAPRMNF